MDDVFSTAVLGNSIGRWSAAVGVVLGARLALGVLRRALHGRLGRWLASFPGEYDDALVDTIAGTRAWFVWAVALYGGSLCLHLPGNVRRALDSSALTLALIQAGLWAQHFVRASVQLWTAARSSEDDGFPKATTAAAAITFISNVAIWSLVALLTLQNAGVEIGALLAGLGVGGIAAALALQAVLGDLFASLSIYIDRPFDLGDFIVVGDFMGTVEKVGLRTTRLSALGGEQLVLPNGDLMKSRIRNYKRMNQRRVVNRIGVVYKTTYPRLREIPTLLREIVESASDVRFDRAHFAGYGDSSLDFEFVYYILSPDYNTFMDRQQEILYEAFRRFEEAGIDFAFPTRTVYVQPEAARPATRS